MIRKPKSAKMTKLPHEHTGTRAPKFPHIRRNFFGDIRDGVNRVNYLCEIGSDEGLFHTNPNGDRNQKLLVGFFALIHCGR